MTREYFRKVVQAACELASADGATLFLVDGPFLRPYVIFNLPKEYIDGIGAVRIGEQCCGRAVAHKKPWIVTDMLTDPLFAEGRQGAVASPIRAAFSVPVIDGDETVGSLACHFLTAHSPSALDIERNEVFARVIAMALRGRDDRFLCKLCGNPVSIEAAKTDERGHAVHEDCYVRSLEPLNARRV